LTTAFFLSFVFARDCKRLTRWSSRHRDLHPLHHFRGLNCDERRARLRDIVDEGASFLYTYDFGDGWRHRIVVEKITPLVTGQRVPSCIDGRRAGRPRIAEAHGDTRSSSRSSTTPRTPEHVERLDGIGRPFDPDVFDPGEFEDNLRNATLASFDDA
jgi:hypothetical protein